MSDFFGELYLRSTRPFLTELGDAAESAFLQRHFEALPLEGPVLDLGCGHGRHLRRVGQGTGRLVLGLDFDALSLAEAAQTSPVVRGDFFSLPFQTASLAGAWCWYNTLFTFDDATQRRGLLELHRCVKPNGLLVLQTQPRERIARQPEVHYHGVLPDGSTLDERATFDPARSRDVATRTLTLPDGRVMAADYFIRYYSADELMQLVESAGWRVQWVIGSLDGAEIGPDSTDLIVGAQRG